MTVAALSAFFGWMAVLNMALLTFATATLLMTRDWATGLHARLFGLDPADVRLTYYRWLATYKAMTFVFSIIPWAALQII